MPVLGLECKGGIEGKVNQQKNLVTAVVAEVAVEKMKAMTKPSSARIYHQADRLRPIRTANKTLSVFSVEGLSKCPRGYSKGLLFYLWTC